MKILNVDYENESKSLIYYNIYYIIYIIPYSNSIGVVNHIVIDKEEVCTTLHSYQVQVQVYTRKKRR